jgi:hypothetical protein
MDYVLGQKEQDWLLLLTRQVDVSCLSCCLLDWKSIRDTLCYYTDKESFLFRACSLHCVSTLSTLSVK